MASFKILLGNLLWLLCASIWGENILTADQSQFLRNEPNDMLELIEPISISASYDKENLYIHAVMAKNEDMIFGNLVNHETYQKADYLRVQVVVSPNDRFGYIYYAYPNGSLLDGVRKSDLNISNDWDSNYSYKTFCTDSEWIVDFTIPFNDLNYPNLEVHKWKLASL
jgi:predicted transcriptional regulator